MAEHSSPDSDLLQEVLETLRHARVFITSRERMHIDGVALYDDAIEHVKAALERAPAQCACGRPLECPECMSLRTEPQESQIVAWRWRRKGNTDWWTGETVPTAISGNNGNWEIEPLGFIQPQAASDDALAERFTDACFDGLAVATWSSVYQNMLSLLECVRAPPQAAWQTIESRPKDEMFIWAYRRDGKWSIGLAYQNVSGGWSDAYGSDAPNHATHWAPLPAPPSLSRPQQE